MIAVQSLWTKPFLKGSGNNDLSRVNGGFFEKKYFYMSCCLSALLLNKWFPKVELITDRLGKYILIDLLKLPYTSVKTDLEKFEYHSDLWALGKIYAYIQQTQPFIHIDFDVFLLNKLDDNFLKSPVFSQNVELNFPCYSDSLKEIKSNFKKIPSYFIDNKNITAYNCGLFGGQNIDFIVKYAQQAFYFVMNNYDFLEKIDIAKFNMIYEQYLLSEYANLNNVVITPLLKNVDSQFTGLANFNSNYVHLVGFYKKCEGLCKTMEIVFKNMFSFYYNNLINVLNSNIL